MVLHNMVGKERQHIHCLWNNSRLRSLEAFDRHAFKRLLSRRAVEVSKVVEVSSEHELSDPSDSESESESLKGLIVDDDVFG
jgi:hypothetical protein